MAEFWKKEFEKKAIKTYSCFTYRKFLHNQKSQHAHRMGLPF